MDVPLAAEPRDDWYRLLTEGGLREAVSSVSRAVSTTPGENKIL